MTKANLENEVLDKLKTCRSIALDNLKFYECLYDSLEDSSERDNIGRAMAQKHSFVGAVDAILNNHAIDVPDTSITAPANDCRDVLKDIETGEHLEQEERFYGAVQACIHVVSDNLTIDLLKHHLEAAELALATIEATSLKI